MTVDFALFLSPEGIALAHRQAAGHWALVAEARLDDGDLGAAMAGLKAAAAERGGDGAGVLLVLPDDQILYTSFMAPADDAEAVVARITEGLDGATPYAVSDLTYDWRAVEADRVKVAVVARETLEEATAFVAGYGFSAAGFAAMPPAERFPGMPLFGDDRPELPDAATGMAFGADAWVPPAAPEPEPEPEPEAAATEDPTAEAPAAEPEAEVAPVAAEAEPAPETPPEPEPEPEPEPAEEAAAPAVAEEEPAPAPIADPTLDQPVLSILEDAEPEPARAADTAAEPEAEPEAQPEPEPEAPAVADAPVAARGKAPKPSAEARPLTAEKPEGGAPRPARAARFTPTPAEPLRAEPELPPAPAEGPALGFGARRGKAARPEAEAGQIVSSRRSRLGFGAAPEGDAEAPVLHPDAAPPLRPEPAPAGPGSRLAAQLARVRDASKARPKPEPAPPPRTVPAPAPSAEVDIDDLAEAPAAARVTAPEEAPRRGGLFRRPARAAAAAAGGGAATADRAFTSGLLARKPSEPAGPSFKTGLILTLVLLVLLALIALWSVLFLPESPMARLFGGGQTEATLADDPLDGPAPPVAVTAPPAMAALDPAPAAPEAVAAAPVADPTASATDPPAATELAALVPEAEAPPLSDPEAAADGEIAAAETPAPAEAPLPDIDAEIELPPLPPLPEDMLPSIEETEALYAAARIWPRTPDRPYFEPFPILDDLYIASIDPEVSAFDAVALTDPGINPAETLRRVPPPPPFGVTPERDARGLVAATPEGVLTPEGAFVVLGRPPIAAVPRPREVEPAAAPAAPALGVEDAILGTFQPTPRPADLDETRERQVLGGLTVTELAGLRPGQRPVSAQEAAAQASLFPADEAAPAEETAAAAAADPAPEPVGGTALAVAASRMPSLRPADIATIVAAAERAPEEVVAVAATAVAAAPSIPSNADVARAATERNAIRLRDVNLIGVTGTPSNRRALVRLPSGRFVRVAVGDRLDGGRVAAIGETSLQYVRNGRNITLEIPG
ncbi:hypothetical protein [Roseicyclus persicicus]|uniref:Uncharacterized protein n=1 Tax=Roseicyclus persicicus TaxID=2650661 RepID=A0A7X6GZC0_9RHOB|nr:hypothetical protein [Roseibacterium persicicum]NKX43897.1 hypothetical protein [Roseibacterium persicicum]